MEGFLPEGFAQTFGDGFFPLFYNVRYRRGALRAPVLAAVYLQQQMHMVWHHGTGIDRHGRIPARDLSHHLNHDAPGRRKCSFRRQRGQMDFRLRFLANRQTFRLRRGMAHTVRRYRGCVHGIVLPENAPPPLRTHRHKIGSTLRIIKLRQTVALAGKRFMHCLSLLPRANLSRMYLCTAARNGAHCAPLHGPLTGVAVAGKRLTHSLPTRLERYGYVRSGAQCAP